MDNNGLREHPIKLHTAVMMIYCLVAAGAFGIEEMIPESGPGMTIIMLCALPFLWAAPQALCSAELGSAITEAGGFYKWVQRGLGEFWGFQAGWCRTLSCYVDQTVYIVLAAGYLNMFIPMSSAVNTIVMFSMIGIFTIINLLGIKEIGAVSTIFSTLIFLAFTAVTIVGFYNWTYNPIDPLIPEGYTAMGSIGGSLAIGMWMYSGYTSMSTLSAECIDKSVIPKGLLIAMPIIALSYILPTIAGLASLGHWEDWSTSGGISFGNVLGLAGSWGVIAFFLVAVCSNLSLFNTQMISISRGFYGMALDNLAPKSIVKVSKNRGIPYISVLSLTVVSCILCNIDFSLLVTIDVTLLMVDYVLVFISAARLRITEPDMPRPFKIPGGTGTVVALICPGLFIAFMALLLNGSDYFLGGMIGLISSPVMYVIWKRMYGGMYKRDPERYPINPRTQLGIGDLHRMCVILFFFAIIGLFGSYFFFPWYEGEWAVEYYMDTYNAGENVFTFILNAIKTVSWLYLVFGIVLKIVAVKIDPKYLELTQELQSDASEL